MYTQPVLQQYLQKCDIEDRGCSILPANIPSRIKRNEQLALDFKLIFTSPDEVTSEEFYNAKNKPRTQIYGR